MNFFLFDLSIYFHITLDKIPVVTTPQFNRLTNSIPSNYDKIEQHEKKLIKSQSNDFFGFCQFSLLVSFPSIMMEVWCVWIAWSSILSCGVCVLTEFFANWIWITQHTLPIRWRMKFREKKIGQKPNTTTKRRRRRIATSAVVNQNRIYSIKTIIVEMMQHKTYLGQHTQPTRLR